MPTKSVHKPLAPFAVAVRQIRRSKGLSQLEVAKAGGLGRGYVAMLETGERGDRPSRDSVLRVARGLDATTDETNVLLKSAGFPVMSLPVGMEGVSLADVIHAQADLTDDAKKTLIQVYETLRAL